MGACVAGGMYGGGGACVAGAMATAVGGTHGLFRQSLNRTGPGKNGLHYYRPQTMLRKGNVFTTVCQEFCP